MKYINQEQFVELLKAKVKENELRELSASEERDPLDVIPNVQFYVDELDKEYKVGVVPKPKVEPKKEVKKSGKAK